MRVQCLSAERMLLAVGADRRAGTAGAAVVFPPDGRAKICRSEACGPSAGGARHAGERSRASGPVVREVNRCADRRAGQRPRKGAIRAASYCQSARVRRTPVGGNGTMCRHIARAMRSVGIR